METRQRVSTRLRGFSKALRHDATEAEQRMWSILSDRRFVGYKFRRQVPIGPYIADFCCFAERLIVELDGSQHADSASDVRRDVDLHKRGFRLLRIWNSDLTHNRAGVLDAVWAALQEPS